MNSAIVIPYVDAFGGVERLAVGLVSEMSKHGISTRIVCFRQTIDLASYAACPIEVTELVCARHPVAEAWALRRYLATTHRSEGPAPLLFDLKGAFLAALGNLKHFGLHLTDPPSLLPADVSKYASSARRAYAALGRNIPARSPSQTLRAEIVHRLNRLGIRRADPLISMTDAIAFEIRGLYRARAGVIRPGVAHADASGPVRQHGRRLHILSVSRLEKTKRVDMILRAVARLRSEGPRWIWNVDLVGSGPEMSALRALAADLGVQDAVRFHGHVSDAELGELYGAASIFAMPAIQGYGLPALEALVRGVPVVLTMDSGVSEILRDTPWARITTADPASFALGISEMVNRIVCRELEHAPTPHVPSEQAWAEAVRGACRWSSP